MPMRLFIPWIALLSCLPLLAQQVDRREHAFGKVRGWDNPEATFLLTNTSGKVQHVLSYHYDSDIQVSVDERSLQPGQQTTVHIRYYTEEYGRFEREIPIYLSTQPHPVWLRIKGQIKSFHPDAFTVCPPVGGDQAVVLPSILKVVVKDAQTGQEIPETELRFSGRGRTEKRTYDGGELVLEDLPADLYRLEADHADYLPYTEVRYINRATGRIEILLDRLSPADAVNEPNRNVGLERDPTDAQEQENDPSEDEGGWEIGTDFPEEPEAGAGPIEEDSPADEGVIAAEPEETGDLTEEGQLNSAVFKPNHIVFVIDVSGSMDKPDKLPLLKWSMASLIRTLRPEDKVSIITYASGVHTVLKEVSGSQADVLMDSVLSLEAKGQSFGSEALDKAYDLARSYYIENGNNEIILASDGLLNSPNFSKREEYWRAWYQYQRQEIRLSTICFGRSSYAVEFMQELSSRGRGNFMQIRDEEAAKVMLISNLMDHSRK